jgi:hypothetical protein
MRLVSNKNSLREIDQGIRREVPIGSRVGDVERYLSRRKIEFTNVKRERTIYAIIRNIRGGSIFASKSASIRIKYNDRGVVCGVDVFASYL